MKKYYLLSPAKFKLDGGAMFGIIPKPLWEKKAPADDLNRIELDLRLVLIDMKSKLILIDTGIGDYHGDKWDQRFDVTGPDNPIETALKTLGKTPDDITDVILTHLHFDHAGGLIIQRDGQYLPLFKKALLHLHRDHYLYGKNPTARDQGSFESHIYEPVISYYENQNQIHWLEGENGEILSHAEGGLNFLTSHGHTPYLIHPYNEHFLYLADLIPTHAHVKVPWVMGYDISPGITVNEKEQVLKFIHEHGLIGIFEHDPKFWGARLEFNSKQQIDIEKTYSTQDEALFEISF